ncbi:unnamed protein product [Thelazia callipaeda]|uniref:SUN domain-containing protein n=1 Tax=Thelazia callipaeda TaxID=103827 RepID=A0A0N5CRC4_THECL|nr:unnamed protein product [Thelazia callipaeda]
MNSLRTCGSIFMVHLVSVIWFISDYHFPVCWINQLNETLEVYNVEMHSLKSSLENEVTNPMKNVEAGNDISSSPEISQSVTFSADQLPIVTFDEWTKEKLKREEIRKAEQQQNNQNKIVPSDVIEASNLEFALPSSGGVEDKTVHLPHSIIPQEAAARNYASKECGAKVLFSNEEAENKNGVLNEKEADDYMRNPCERAEHKWLIIELCETVQPTYLQIANFELFSSGPQNIRISGSERYPSNDWFALGDFIAENSREIQKFPITARSYIKFLRLELLTHYGREHYCTLSLIRLLGISMVDEYEAEAEAAAAISDSSFTFQAVALENIDLTNSTVITNTTGSTPDVSGTLALQKNKSGSELPFVDAVVNAVGNIGIGDIKDVLKSTFSSKSRESSHSVSREAVAIVELCTKCYTDTTDRYFLFCRAFFRFPHKFNGTSNSDILNDRKEGGVYMPIKKLDQRKENIVQTLDAFLISVLPTKVCDLELKESENVHNFVPQAQTELNDSSSIHNTVIPSGSSSTLTGKLAGGFMIPGGVISHKESIFLKLNKRISNLELNMSLSSEYLSELSRRYVFQTNESRRQAELIIKQAEGAAVNAVRPAIEALKIQVNALQISLDELMGLVKNLSEQSIPLQRSLMLKHIRNEDDKVDTFLAAHPEPFFYDYHDLWTNRQLVCVIVFVVLLTILILAVLYFVVKVINRGAVSEEVKKQFQKSVQKIDNNLRTDVVKEDNESISPEENTEEKNSVDLSVVSGTADFMQTHDKSICRLKPADEVTLTDNEGKEESTKILQLEEINNRPLSQLSTASEQNVWQIKRRKKKKHKKKSKKEYLNEKLCGFQVFSALDS